MTKQKIFNKVYRHLLTQMKKSRKNGRCAYRGEDGCKCAAGVLIPDKIYNPSLEGRRFYLSFKLASWQKVKKYFGNSMDEGFVRELQDIHDFIDPKNWKACLSDMALQENLTIPKMN